MLSRAGQSRKRGIAGPAVDRGPSGSIRRLLAEGGGLTNLDFRAGAGELSFPEAGDDPIARLGQRKAPAAIHGTMDDFYPETVRVLKPSPRS